MYLPLWLWRVRINSEVMGVRRYVVAGINWSTLRNRKKIQHDVGVEVE